MRKSLIIFFIVILCCTGCRKEVSTTDTIIDRNVDSETLLFNLEDYIEYEGNIKNENELNLTFTFRDEVKVPENPPVVQAKVYLWLDESFVGIYYKPIYNKYDDYLDAVEATVDAQGKKFNRYTISLEGNTQ